MYAVFKNVSLTVSLKIMPVIRILNQFHVLFFQYKHLLVHIDLSLLITHLNTEHIFAIIRGHAFNFIFFFLLWLQCQGILPWEYRGSAFSMPLYIHLLIHLLLFFHVPLSNIYIYFYIYLYIAPLTGRSL